MFPKAQSRSLLIQFNKHSHGASGGQNFTGTPLGNNHQPMIFSLRFTHTHQASHPWQAGTGSPLLVSRTSSTSETWAAIPPPGCCQSKVRSTVKPKLANRYQELNSDPQSWQQVPLCAEPSYKPNLKKKIQIAPLLYVLLYDLPLFS